MNWKYIAQTKGYKSLKAAYIEDVQKSSSTRSKVELLNHFNWVINRAKHYAYREKCSLEVILNAWEQARNYWWLNFYQNSNQPKYYKYPKRYKQMYNKKQITKKRWPQEYKKLMKSVS